MNISYLAFLSYLVILFLIPHVTFGTRESGRLSMRNFGTVYFMLIKNNVGSGALRAFLDEEKKRRPEARDIVGTGKMRYKPVTTLSPYL